MDVYKNIDLNIDTAAGMETDIDINMDRDKDSNLDMNKDIGIEIVMNTIEDVSKPRYVKPNR